jgi:predicted ATPase
LAFTDVPGISTGEAIVSGPLFLIAGPNSVGKTTLLRAMYTAVIAGSKTDPKTWDEVIPAGSVTVDMDIKGKPLSSMVEVQTEGVAPKPVHDCDVVHIDGAKIVHKFRALFPPGMALEEIISGDPQRELTGDELAQINYITGRQYRRVAISEVERDDQTIPFFEVSYGDDSYDTRTMGSGELAAFYLWWSLDRAQSLSIILLEEPETFLSPAVQRAFADYLVVQIAKRTLFCAATTHSESLITPTSLQNVAFVTRGSGTVDITSNPHPAQLETIGITATKDIFVFVEDAAGKVLLESMLSGFNPALARRTRVFVSGGEGGITKRLREVAGTFEGTYFLGAYDGDQAGKIPGDVAYFSCTLPGSVGIEKLLRAHVVSNVNEFQEKTGYQQLKQVLPTIEGLEDHDWFTRVAQEAGLEKYQLMKLVIRMWGGVQENFDAVNGSYQAFADLIAKLEQSPLPSAGAAVTAA